MLLMKLTTLCFLLGYASVSSASRLNFGLNYWDKNNHKRTIIPPAAQLTARADQASTNSTTLWLSLDEYAGSSFFDRFDFYTGTDPTHGQVNYVDRNTSFSSGLTWVTDSGIVMMKGDNTTWLDKGVYRNSVRISSYTQYNGGLFILDLNRAPWGCGTWPAFWTLGNGQWPYNGEIDIIEGVHDNQHNQVAWHTNTGCLLTKTPNQTGTVVQLNGQDNLVCDGNVNQNSGCAVTEWSRASYGPFFDEQGGGVFVMKWDELGISVWSFYRATVPQDILDGSPDPTKWGNPSATLLPDNCSIPKYFANHSIIFDITFCGDWAGNSYATSGCPGTCDVQLMDPNNFVNASWSINSLKVYRKQVFNGQVIGASERTITSRSYIPELVISLFVIYVSYMFGTF